MEANYAHRLMEKVLVLEANYANLLGAVRGVPGLKVAVDDDSLIWLRGITTGTEADKITHSLPVLYSYTLGQDNLLFLAGKRTPTQKLPELNWQPIGQFIPVTLPVSALPDKVTTPIPLMLKRSVLVKDNFALLVSLTEWKTYAETAPETRLKQLRFAVSAEAKVLIYGQPLPNLPGKAYWQSGAMLLPAGFDFDPPLIGNLIAQQREQQAFMLFNADGNWQEIPLSAFEPAKRSAIRLTRVEHD